MLALRVQRPEKLPLLKAICWQNDDIQHFTDDEMLNRYERDWDYKDVFPVELDEEELRYIAALAKEKGSWLVNEL